MKTALITGASRGIGAETAKVFAENGYCVYVNYFKSKQSAEDLVKQITDNGLDAHAIYADVSKEDDVAAMFGHIERYCKRLDVLVNNAGVSLYRQIQDVESADYDRVMDVNCKGAFLCSKYAAKLMLKRDFGSIVNVSSIWGLNGASCESVYSMSKFAIVGLTRSLAAELEDAGIRVNCICPPIVSTSMNARFTDEEVDEFNTRFSTRTVSPREVAQEIYRLSQTEANGEILDKF
ncbi:MAG: SDR family NAD(P)-dependent oxidoreductase [Corallococcus sp.]|nr:SDR family NAD(P)-dependent oxidoreductase [Corallococcus sp.]